MIKKIQGTDGVRGKISTGFSQNPLNLFLSEGFLSPTFFEIYCFAYLKAFGNAESKTGNARVALAYDPRDKTGLFRRSAIAGIGKAGFGVLDIGVAPTPALVLATITEQAFAGFMLTASHNPADQHGIKIFKGGTGLKLTPAEEERLTGTLFALFEKGYKFSDPGGTDVKIKPVMFDYSEKFSNFIRKNSTGSQERFQLVVDGANGAAAGLLTWRGQGPFPFHSVTNHAVNCDGKNPINHDGGVGEIEGLSLVSRETIESGDSFLSRFPVFTKMFSLAAEDKDIKTGDLLGLVFDGDADRCFPLVYLRECDSVRIFSGDETAAVICRGSENKVTDLLFTVESDLNLSNYFPEVESKIHAVGDKWILKNMHDGLSQKELKNPLGFEESGHMIFPASDDEGRTVLSGNGILAGIKFIEALQALQKSETAKDFYQTVLHPFPEGLKTTIPVYWVRKSKLNPAELIPVLLKNLKEHKIDARTVEFTDEPGMIYFSLLNLKKKAAIFIRNSGTENKTNIYVRGDKADEESLNPPVLAILEKLIPIIKDTGSEEAAAQKEILSHVAEKSPDQNQLQEFIKTQTPAYEKVLRTMIIKEKIITQDPKGKFTQTETGKILHAFFTSSPK